MSNLEGLTPLGEVKAQLEQYESYVLYHENKAQHWRREAAKARQRVEELSLPEEPQNLHDAVFYMRRCGVGEVARRNLSGRWETTGDEHTASWQEIVAKAQPGTLCRLEPGEALN